MNTESTERQLGAWVLLVGLGLGLPALYSVHAALPPNAIQLPFADRIEARKWAPQGWAFFTRDPREPDVIAYLPSISGSWRRDASGPQAQVAYAFGWSRRLRAKGVEMGRLLTVLRPSDWRECHAEPPLCFGSLPVQSRLRNSSPIPSLCGDVAFVQQEPVPWAWFTSGVQVTMPSKVIRVKVSC
jgi:antimicrobial peptide system SdpA family protein